MILNNQQLEWFEPRQIIPDVFQLQTFCLPYLDDLRLGEWPVKPTGYIEHARCTTRNTGSFVTAADLAIELDERLSRIVDSIALILFYTLNPTWSIEHIARSLHYDELELETEMRRMLKYLAGRNRKRQTYSQWRADVRRARIHV